MTLPARFWAKVNKRGPTPIARPDLGRCWVWTAHRNTKGYGRFWKDGRLWYTHLLSYVDQCGTIPDGHQPDHLCRNTSCVRPSHMEVVTVRVNILRSNGAGAIHARKTHCPQGHEYSPDNTYVCRGTWRYCVTCRKARAETKRAAIALSKGGDRQGGGVSSPGETEDPPSITDGLW